MESIRYRSMVWRAGNPAITPPPLNTASFGLTALKKGGVLEVRLP